VPFLVILDSYESYMQRDESFSGTAQDIVKRSEQLSNMIDVIDYWISSASNGTSIGSIGSDGKMYGSNEAAAMELKRAVASGRLMPKLDGMRSKLETMPNSAILLQRIRGIEESIQYLRSY